MRRGDIIKAALAGDYGKPRPAVVVQTDRLPSLASVILCPLTSDLTDALPLRVAIEPTEGNGLRLPSHIMVDKVTALPRSKCREIIGRLDEAGMQQLNESLALVIGLAD